MTINYIQMEKMVSLIRESLNVSSIFCDYSVLGTVPLSNEIQHVKAQQTAANCGLSTGVGSSVEVLL